MLWLWKAGMWAFAHSCPSSEPNRICRVKALQVSSVRQLSGTHHFLEMGCLSSNFCTTCAVWFVATLWGDYTHASQWTHWNLCWLSRISWFLGSKSDAQVWALLPPKCNSVGSFYKLRVQGLGVLYKFMTAWMVHSLAS